MMMNWAMVIAAGMVALLAEGVDRNFLTSRGEALSH